MYLCLLVSYQKAHESCTFFIIAYFTTCQEPCIPSVLPKTKWKWKLSHSVVSNFLHPMDCSLPGSHPWDFPGTSTREGCRFLLQGVFPTQGLNPGLPLYSLSRQGNPKTKYYKSIDISKLLIILVSSPTHPPIFNILPIFLFLNKILSIFQPKWSTYVCTVNKENNDILGTMETCNICIQL